MDKASKHTEKFLYLIRKCNQFVAQDYVEFIIEDEALGAVNKRYLHLFSNYPSVFQVFSDKVVLHPNLADPESRTEVINRVLKEWHSKGIIPTWRNELYRVSTSINSEPYMLIERSASPFLGFLNFGVHINGIVRQGNEMLMWIARRSNLRPSFPGFLDQFVAGGHPASLTTDEVVVKECAEEAGIPFYISQKAISTGTISYCMDFDHNLKRDIIFIYDLEVPIDFVPKNSDGEVSEFLLLPIEKVIELVTKTSQFKTNCNLVLIDFFLRHGYVHADDPKKDELSRKLHSPVLIDSLNLNQ